MGKVEGLFLEFFIKLVTILDYTYYEIIDVEF
jgi:hypothetical protein